MHVNIDEEDTRDSDEPIIAYMLPFSVILTFNNKFQAGLDHVLLVNWCFVGQNDNWPSP